MFNTVFLLVNYIEKDPGVIIGFISKILGYIVNIVFSLICNISYVNSLGFTIILFTIIVRLLLTPLSYKQQLSALKIKKLQPEVKKIQEKYSHTKDQEAMRKMNMEINALYAKNKCNPFSGCLPLLIQLPILLALFFIMKNSYLFITEISNIYTQIAKEIQNTDNYIDVISPIASAMTPAKLDAQYDITIIEDLKKYLAKFTLENWEYIQDAMPSLNISELLVQKNQIETFFSLNLTETVGLTFPNIIIVVLSAGSTFLSGYLMSRRTMSEDNMMQKQQKVFNIIMPIMIALLTINVPCGVGIYWISGNIIQIFQYQILNKICSKKLEKEA